MVAVSGGKDSYGMLPATPPPAQGPVRLRAVAVNLDQEHRATGHLLEDGFSEGYGYRMLSEDTYSVVKANIRPDAPPAPVFAASARFCTPRQSNGLHEDRPRSPPRRPDRPDAQCALLRTGSRRCHPGSAPTMDGMW